MKLSFKGGLSTLKRGGAQHIGIDLSGPIPVVLVLRPGRDLVASVVHAGLCPVPESAYAMGDVTDAALLAGSVRDYLKHHHLTGSRVGLALGASKAYVEKIVVDKTDDAMLALQAEDHLQAALNCDAGDFNFDYQPAHDNGAEPDTCALAVAAVRVELIDSLTDAFARCDIPLTSIEVEPFAQVDGALQLTRQKESGNLCLVQCDPGKVRLIRVSHGMVISDTSVGISGSAWIEAACWALEQLLLVVAVPSGVSAADPLQVLLTGECAQRADWIAAVQRSFKSPVQSMYQYKPSRIPDAVWGQVSTAYAVARGGMW